MTYKNAIRRILALVALAVLAALAAGCGDDEEGQAAGQDGQAEARRFDPGTTMRKIQEKGEIVIGVKYDVPPFGFENPQSGEVEGFDVDLGRAVADELGVEPKFIEAVSDNRIPFLRQGTVDLILSTMTINEERNQEIDFSDPYYIANSRLLVEKDSGIEGWDDLAGKGVCTALGSTNADLTRERAPKADLKLVDTYSECLELLQNGAIEGISTDNVILTGMIIQDDSLHMVGEELSVEPYGAGLAEGDRGLQRFLNEVISDYESDGRWAEAYQKWVGQYVDQKQEPPTMTLKEALALS